MQNKKAINILINDIAMETESHFYGWGSTLWNKNKSTHLGSLSIIFILAGERCLIETFHYLTNPFSRVSQHGPQGHTCKTQCS